MVEGWVGGWDGGVCFLSGGWKMLCGGVVDWGVDEIVVFDGSFGRWWVGKEGCFDLGI